MAWLGLFGPWRSRRAGDAKCHSYSNTQLCGLYVWVSSRRASGRQRTTDSEDYCHCIGTKRRRPIYDRPFHFHAVVCDKRNQQDAGTVFQLVVFVAACLGIFCFAAFLYLIDYAARLLRPISILSRVGQAGLKVIESVYPEPTLGANRSDAPRHELGEPGRVIPHGGTSEIVLAANLRKLITQAQRSKGVIEFVPQVGDFIATDEPLFKLYGGAASLDADDLRSAVAFGLERTMEQDPTFAYRIVVDIALKALSPAINDPTTAVIAIDQLHRLLRQAGNRNLRTDEILAKSGQLLVLFRTPNWEDFVHLAFTEIRQCGAQNMQIARRLRAMIDNLIETLPKHRHAVLLEELKLLDRDVERHFVHPEDRALARLGDSQGLGGASGTERMQKN